MECRLYPESGDGECVDLGRNWEALTFLFAGSADPVRRPETLLVDDWPDIEGSEATIINADAVAAFADWIERHPDTELLGRFDPAAMAAAGIYRSSVISDMPEEVFTEMSKQLADLREFVLGCRGRRASVIRVIC